MTYKDVDLRWLFFISNEKRTLVGYRSAVSESSVVLLPENDALQVERVFYDPSGWDSNPKHVLLSW